MTPRHGAAEGVGVARGAICSMLWSVVGCPAPMTYGPLCRMAYSKNSPRKSWPQPWASPSLWPNSWLIAYAS